MHVEAVLSVVRITNVTRMRLVQVDKVLRTKE